MRRWPLAAALAATIAAASWVGSEHNDGSAVARAGGKPRGEQAAPTVRLTATTSTAELAGAYVLKLRQRVMARESVDMFAGRSSEPQVELAPEPPRVPVLPFIYVGRMVEYGEVTAFLEAEGRIHAIKAAQTVDVHYRIEEIRDDTISLTYLPLGLQQTLQLRALTDSAHSSGIEGAPAPAMGRRTRRARLNAAPFAER